MNYNITIEKKDEKKLMLVIVVFLIAVCVLLTVSVVTAINTHKKAETYKPAQAQIVGSGFDGSPILEYYAEGSVKQASLNYSSSSMYIGKKLNILYDPNDTSKIIMAGIGGYFVPLLCGGMSVFFAGFSAIFIVAMRKQNLADQTE